MAAGDKSEDSGMRDGRTTLPITEPVPRRAWERVEAGRYRPLRIRGSFPGRELG